jgi:hypothetical protein
MKKHIRRIFFLLSAGSVIIFLYGCRPDYMKAALTEIDSKKGEVAVNFITDQDSLFKIAVKAKDEYVSFCATKKITDPALLSKIESESNSVYVRDAATKELTRQGLDSVGKLALSNKEALAQIAMETNYEQVAMAAVKKIYDPSLLAQIALENKFSNVTKSALIKLTGSGMPATVTTEKDDEDMNLMNNLIKAFIKIPQEHSIRLMDRTISIIRLLKDPEVVKVTGEILDINVSWEQASQSYTETLNDKNMGYAGTKPGEKFTCTIKLAKLSRPLSHTWTTKFLNSEGSRLTIKDFRSADIYIGDIFAPVIIYLSQATLKYIYDKYDDYNLHMGIIQYLSDLAFLKRICEEERSGNGFSPLGVAAERRIKTIMAISPM